MERSRNTTIISDHLVFLNQKIELNGKLNLNNLSIHSESFFCQFFNILFELKLTNANFEKSNHEAIDLIDKNNRLIIQVSATCSKQKIENTLKKEVLKRYTSEGYRVQFIFIGKQNDQIKTNTFSNPNGIKFTPSKDIFLTKDIIEKFMSLSLEKQKNILAFIKQEIPLLEFNNKTDSKKGVCGKIQLLLKKNFLIWESYGPHSEIAILTPMAESVKKVWDYRKKDIFKNNKDIIELYHRNASLFTSDESDLFIEFEEHAIVFCLNSTDRIDSGAYKPFPQKFRQMINEITSESSD